MSTHIFGKKVSSPICVAPVGLQKLVHTEGELEVMKAVEKRGNGYSLSTGATTLL